MWDSEFWKQQWTAIMTAPYIMVPGLGVAGVVGWVLRGMTSIAGLKATIAGLSGTITVLNERIRLSEDRVKLAAEKVETADKAKAELEKQFKTLKEEVAAGRGAETLASTAAKVDAAIADVSAANNAARVALSAVGIITAKGSLSGEGRSK